MVDLFCTPFVDLIQRMRLEFRNQQAIFDLPARKWYVPAAEADAPDLSVRFHDRVAGNASGPASGPQTQMAQNLVLSWLAGGRIMELKTVQVNDELKISRPCIDAANIGYNVEWSQELRVADSLDQYVQGAMLIHMLRHAPEVFGHPFGDVSMAGTSGETDLRHVDRLRPGRHPNAEGRRLHSRHDRRARKRRAAARPDSALARAAARPRLSDAS